MSQLALLLTCALFAADADPASRLREAWILHRFEGRRDEARAIYEALFQELAPNDTAVDLRARAAIGLGILAREQGDLALAVSWLERASALDNVSARWARNALDLKDQIERAENESDQARFRKMEERNTDLLRQLAEQTREIDQRAVELKRLGKLIDDLNEPPAPKPDLRGGDLAPGEVGRLLESMVEEERESRTQDRYWVERWMAEAREHYRSGRFLNAYNELKRVLQLEPYHREALELSTDCRSLLASVVGERSAPEVDRDERQTLHSKRLVLESMRAHLKEGKDFYAAGKINAAIDALDRVLYRYTWSPVALSEEEVETLVRPAEGLLKLCCEAGGKASEVVALSGEQEKLLSRLRENRELLTRQEEKRAVMESDLQRMQSEKPREAEALALRNLEQSIAEAARETARGDRSAALAALRNAETFIAWFPALDPDGSIARDVAEQIRRLEEPLRDARDEAR